MYALDAESGKLRWRFQTDGEVRSSPAIAGGLVYIGSNDDHLYALDAEVGDLVWKYETDDDIRVPVLSIGETVYFGSYDYNFYAVRAGLQPGYSPPVALTAPMPPTFEPLTPEEMRDLLEVLLQTVFPTVGGRSYVSSGGNVTTTEFSFVDDIIEVFETGYYLLTGSTAQEEGWTWIPRIMTLKEYLAFVDERHDGDPVLRLAAAFCCERTAEGLELLIKGSAAPAGVISSLAHEAGHARQRILNPVQSKSGRNTNLAAIREAQAYAFQAGLLRVLGEYAGVNATQFPVTYTFGPVINAWSEDAANFMDDLSQEHERARVLLWLAALHDTLLDDMKKELSSNQILSPGSLLAVTSRQVV